MLKLAVLAAALILSGCSTVSGLNQRLVDQAQPEVVRKSNGEAWIWLRGLVPTVMLRFKDGDAPKGGEVPGQQGAKPASQAASAPGAAQ